MQETFYTIHLHTHTNTRFLLMSTMLKEFLALCLSFICFSPSRHVCPPVPNTYVSLLLCVTHFPVCTVVFLCVCFYFKAAGLQISARCQMGMNDLLHFAGCVFKVCDQESAGKCIFVCCMCVCVYLGMCSCLCAK